MSLNASAKQKSNVPPMEAGVMIGTCYLVCDLGTHADPVFGGKKRKVLIGFEVPSQRIQVETVIEGRKVVKDLPRAISQRYTLSLGEKANLRKDLEAWRGRKFTKDELEKFDLQKLLGHAAQLVVVHKEGKEGQVFANIQAIIPLSRGMEKPKQENNSIFFSFDDLTPGSDIPTTVNKWIVDIIHGSEEWQEHLHPKVQEEPDAVDTENEVAGHGEAVHVEPPDLANANDADLPF